MIHNHVRHTVKNEYSIIPSKTYSFDRIQVHFECCGASGPSDWASSKFNSNSNNLQSNAGIVSSIVNEISKQVKYSVPESCCKVNTTRQQCEDSRTIILSKLFNMNIYTDVSIFWV